MDDRMKKYMKENFIDTSDSFFKPVEAKVWGENIDICERPDVQISFIRVNSGGFCSIHQHKSKSNSFFITRGKVKLIVWWDGIDKSATSVVLNKNQWFYVQAGVYHQFEALEYSEVIEIYHSGGVLKKDIKRITQGGIR